MEDNVVILSESYSAFRFIYERLSIFNTLSADAEIDSQVYDNQLKVASDEEISELLGMEA